MRVTLLFILLSLLAGQLSLAQNIPKITGPLGIYHSSAGYSYLDTAGTDSIVLEYEFRFGELGIANQSVDNGFPFIPDIDSCNEWHVNKVYGIIQPPTEHGIANQPADNSLYAPYPIKKGPGMIQGGQRFSRLSQLYGGFCGVILDDWDFDTAATHQVYDAVKGKYVDDDGNVHTESVATTPRNKLYCVVYNTDSQPAAMNMLDGVVYSFIQIQNCCYAILDSEINLLQATIPNKEIMIAIFLQNSVLGWTDPVSVQYMTAHSLDRYDDGDINGIVLFAGSFLTKDVMPLSLWDSLALPHWLDSLYYPYLGLGQGAIYDCSSGSTLTGASVHVYCRARLTGDTLLRSSQMTDMAGQYQSGLWAGNRNTDSTYYWAVAEKNGYLPDSTGFWVKRNDTVSIPSLSLCPDISTAKDNMLAFPNPSRGIINIQVEAAQAAGSELEIYDVLGQKVYSATQAIGYTLVDMSGLSDGLYLVSLRKDGQQISQWRILLLR